MRKQTYFAEYSVFDGKIKNYVYFNTNFWSREKAEKYLQEKYLKYEFIRIHGDYNKTIDDYNWE